MMFLLKLMVVMGLGKLNAASSNWKLCAAIYTCVMVGMMAMGGAGGATLFMGFVLYAVASSLLFILMDKFEGVLGLVAALIAIGVLTVL